MKSKIILMVLGLMLVLFVYSFSQVPQLINYQGKLTKSTGAPLDTTVQMIFSIYADSNGTILNWTETQAAVKVEKGVFNVLLGSVTPISSSVFDGSVRYLGVKVGTDPEITPRKPMVSVPYAYRAGSIQTNCHDCDSIFVNVNGPDSVITASGTAFVGRASGNSAGEIFGVRGFGDNASTGDAYGGHFQTASEGTGTHWGVAGQGYGSSSSPVVGSFGFASNNSTGNDYGGSFLTSADGTGYHMGLYAAVYGNSSSTIWGSYSEAYNTSTGNAYGYYGLGYNNHTATVYGGYFEASPAGTGTKYGVYATAPDSQGYAGYFSGNTLATGTKTAAVKVNNGEYRLLYSQESPENWFEDFGEGQLANGKVHIELDPLFLQTVTINSQNPIKVFIQLNDPDCKGTAVIRGTTGFDVEELQNGTSNASFSYRVVAKRKGYETLRLAKMGGPTPEEVASEQAKYQAEMENERARMDKEREKMAEER